MILRNVFQPLIQETLVSISDWFGSGTTVGQDEASGQIPTNENAAKNEKIAADELALVTIAEAANCSVIQPSASVFGSRYWGKADLIGPAVKNEELTVANVQEWLNKMVAAMCAE